MHEVYQLANAVGIIAFRCRNGLLALQGRRPKPAREEMKAAFLFQPSRKSASVKVKDGGLKRSAEHDAEIRFQAEFEAALDLIPWEELVEAVKWYADAHSREWNLFRDYIRLMNSDTVNHIKSPVQFVAKRYNVSEPTARKLIKAVPVGIAARASNNGE